MASLVRNLIAERRIHTSLAKAKACQGVAERLVTLARKKTLASRRLVIARLKDKNSAAELIEKVVPALEGRLGGCTRILRLGRRTGDNAELALLEWVGIDIPDKRKKKVKETPEKA
jgi:large subunit ribosomal protein L17